MVLVCFRCRFLPELGCLVALVCRDGLLVCRDPENCRDFWLMKFFLFFFGFDVGPLWKSVCALGLLFRECGPAGVFPFVLGYMPLWRDPENVPYFSVFLWRCVF